VIKVAEKRETRKRIFGNTTGLGRPDLYKMLDLCGNYRLPAFLNVHIGNGGILGVTHNDTTALSLHDALTTLGVIANETRVLIRPDYFDGDTRAFDCAKKCAIMLASKSIKLVILTQDLALLEKIKENSLEVDTCRYIPGNLSELRDPIDMMNRLGCRHLAIDYDYFHFQEIIDLAKNLRGAGSMELWAFTGTEISTCETPLDNGVNVVTKGPVYVLRHMGAYDKL
jgi:hypothetical protein